MSTTGKVTWGAVLTAAVAALTLATFVSRSVAQAEVSPVDRRVTTLEAKIDDLREEQKEIRQDIKELLRRSGP